MFRNEYCSTDYHNKPTTAAALSSARESVRAHPTLSEESFGIRLRLLWDDGGVFGEIVQRESCNILNCSICSDLQDLQQSTLVLPGERLVVPHLSSLQNRFSQE
ncbi:hypothetical protein AMELA_G00059890 [Ameiurus melas]|uniref:Uncharacterized protein n=1 Tax=Ameiurus melas TaxID=219545 RepID=A0A7J6B1N3_AMEME|nr:hypothetical protein AMELA_G00059890 [Ameiurus melas]